jgi:hypothetical protein
MEDSGQKRRPSCNCCTGALNSLEIVHDSRWQ